MVGVSWYVLNDNLLVSVHINIHSGYTGVVEFSASFLLLEAAERLDLKDDLLLWFQRSLSGLSDIQSNNAHIIIETVEDVLVYGGSKTLREVSDYSQNLCTCSASHTTWYRSRQFTVIVIELSSNLSFGQSDLLQHTYSLYII